VELSPRSRGFDIFKTKVPSAVLESGREDTAEKYYRQALLENPRQIAAMRGLASLLSKKGQHEEAVTVLEGYVALVPQDEEGWTRLIESHALRGNWPLATAAAEKARTALPKNEALHLRQAMLFAEMRMYPEAKRALTEIDTEELVAADVLRAASTHQKLGQDQQAKILTDRALAQSGNNAAIVDAAAWFFATNRDAQVRDPARALQLSEKARRIADPPSPGMLGTAAASLAANRRFDEAVEMAALAIEAARVAGDAAFVQETTKRKKMYAEQRAYIDHSTTRVEP
jgi:tetratricopeptide (TPR) repeat protein